MAKKEMKIYILKLADTYYFNSSHKGPNPALLLHLLANDSKCLHQLKDYIKSLMIAAKDWVIYVGILHQILVLGLILFCRLFQDID